MYRPKTGDTVRWFWQDGRPALNTIFTDTGDVRQWTSEAMLARYGDPRPAFLSRPDAAGPDGPAALMADPNSHTYFRFQLDHLKGELPGLLNAAVAHGNPWGLEELSDQLAAYQQAMDFAAAGPISVLRKDYARFLGQVGAPGGPSPITPPPPRPDPNEELLKRVTAELDSLRLWKETILVQAKKELAGLPPRGGGKPTLAFRAFLKSLLGE